MKELGQGRRNVCCWKAYGDTSHDIEGHQVHITLHSNYAIKFIACITSHNIIKIFLEYKTVNIYQTSEDISIYIIVLCH